MSESQGQLALMANDLTTNYLLEDVKSLFSLIFTYLLIKQSKFNVCSNYFFILSLMKKFAELVSAQFHEKTERRYIKLQVDIKISKNHKNLIKAEAKLSGSLSPS